MSADLETGLAPPAFDGRVNVSDINLPGGGQTRQNSRVSEIRWGPTGNELNRDRISLGAESHSEGGAIEAKEWEGRVSEYIKLVATGYRSLAVICTFLAGVQASVLAMTSTQTDATAQIVNGLFFAGLVADIGGAALSTASQRWFEMIGVKLKHLYSHLKETGEGTFVNVAASTFATLAIHKQQSSMEVWLFLALKAPLFATMLGFGFMVAGVMLWVWSHEALIAKVLCTALCVLLVILLPPLAIPRDVKQTLKLFELRRVSG
ncbi:hypothetical protein F5887DRAFT_1284286 [Amanita rubescens]|nr:hypothetical protein F5887DRAFT_1284286 [Amanita rubescens]